MNKFILHILIIFLYVLSLSGQEIQNASNIWYFGDRAGLDFNSSPPTALTDGQLDTQEGVAAISNNNGELLFYTDGITVWDRTHQAMPNANGTLNGHWSSTQSAIIVPNLMDPDIYYIFTTDELGGNNGLSYTSIDMSLQGNGSITSPLGNVINGELNIQLATPVTEKITGVLKPDYSGYWVIAHGWNNNRFYAFEVTCSGINIDPIISDVGNIHSGNVINAVGYMKATVDGQNLALVNRNNGTIDVYDFDNNSGIVSNEFEIKPNDPLIYGIEFSFSADYLYIGGTDIISRYNMSSGILTNIEIDDPSEVNSTNVVRALQLGPDENIYVSVRNLKYISAIYNPEENNPLLTVNAIYLDTDDVGRNCRFGLPNIFYFDLVPLDSVTLAACPNSQVEYNGEFFQAGSINEVNLIGNDGCDSTVILTVEVFDVNNEVLEVEVCEGTSYDYNGIQIPAGTQEIFIYADSNGCDSTVTIIVEALEINNEVLEVSACEGTYYDYNGTQILAGTQESFAYTSSNGCDSIITIIVNNLVVPNANAQVLGTLNCAAIDITIQGSASSGNGPIEYDWQFGGNPFSLNEDITVSVPGIYTLIITDSDNGCTDATEVEVFQDIQEPVAVATASGLINCTSTTVTLDGEGSSGNGALIYNWQDSNGSSIGSDSTVEVSTTGIYTLIVTDISNGCSAIDSTTVAGDDGTSLGYFVFQDGNENGIQEPWEAGVANVYVELYSAGPDHIFYTDDDLQVDWEITGNDGLYLFNCVEPGQYYIKFSINTDTYTFSPQYQGNDNELDSNADPDTGTTAPFTVVQGMPDDLSYDAGIYNACDDFTSGGTIGQNQIICAGDETETLHTVIPPSGGSGTPEYMWLKYMPGGSFPSWIGIPNSNTENYNPGPLYSTTYYRRCIKREACNSFIIESENQVVITVLSSEHEYCTGGNIDPSVEIIDSEEIFFENVYQSFKAYPNPVSNKLKIETSLMSAKSSSLYLYNSMGQLLNVIKIGAEETSIEINMKDYATGLYFLHIPLTSYNSHQVLKIIKK